jgi:hypothetical protein
VGVRAFARRLNRSPSTISRELRRNASTRTYWLEYRASMAQWHRDRRASRPKPAKLVTNEDLRNYVQDRLSGAIVDVHGNPILGPTPFVEETSPRLRVKIGVGPHHGVRSRSPIVCILTKPSTLLEASTIRSLSSL